jgi:hypothetical protein
MSLNLFADRYFEAKNSTGTGEREHGQGMCRLETKPRKPSIFLKNFFSVKKGSQSPTQVKGM